MALNESKKVAIFDFCQTLCDFETADPYLNYLYQNSQTKNNSLWMSFVHKLTNASIVGLLFDVLWHFFHISLKKQVLTYGINKSNKEEITHLSKQFYELRVKTHLIPQTISLLKDYQLRGYSIAVVSASFSDFLVYFAEEYKVDLLVANHLLYDKKGFCLGRIQKPDCIYKKKVFLYNQAATGCNYCVDYSYGDSKSDIPILSIAKTGIVVSHRNHKSWVNNTKFKELIWQ